MRPEADDALDITVHNKDLEKDETTPEDARQRNSQLPSDESDLPEGLGSSDETGAVYHDRPAPHLKRED